MPKDAAVVVHGAVVCEKYKYVLAYTHDSGLVIRRCMVQISSGPIFYNIIT